MEINKNEFVNLIDNSFRKSETDNLTRMCKAIIMCAGLSGDNVEDYISRVTICSLLLDPDKKCNLVCPCQVKDTLGMEHYSVNMFSESKESEK